MSQERGRAGRDLLRICPRCGEPYSYIERVVRGGRVYYYAVHYEGYVKSGGKIKKKVRKCYLGPDYYEYVTKTHYNLGITLKGLHDSTRAVSYLNNLLNTITHMKMDAGTLKTTVNMLESALAKLKARLGTGSAGNGEREPADN